MFLAKRRLIMISSWSETVLQISISVLGNSVVEWRIQQMFNVHIVLFWPFLCVEKTRWISGMDFQCHCRCVFSFIALFLVILVSCIWKPQQDSNWYRDLEPILKKPEPTKKTENTWHIQKLGRPRAHVTTHFFKAPSTSSTGKKSCSRVLFFCWNLSASLTWRC